MMKKTEKILALMLCAAMIAGLLGGCQKKPKRTTKETDETTYGIDVARYQGTIRWAEAAASGVDFAMVRVGMRGGGGGNFSRLPTPGITFRKRRKTASSWACTFSPLPFLRRKPWKKPTGRRISSPSIPSLIRWSTTARALPTWTAASTAMSKTERTDIALAFLKRIEQRGYEGMFYAAKNELQDETLWETSRIEKHYKIWVAQFPGDADPAVHTSSYTGDHQMWQYTMEGSVPGISQAC